MSAWIPIKRRPPGDGGWFLVSIPSERGWSRHVNMAWYEPGRGYGWQMPVNHRGNDMKFPRPTHLMDLPKPARRGEGSSQQRNCEGK